MTATDPRAPADADAAPGVTDALRALGEQARASARSARSTGQALRALVAADLALARTALGQAALLAGVALAFGVSTWLFLLAAGVAGLRALGLPWPLALLLAGLVGAAGTAIAATAAWRRLDHASLRASRRQLARLVPEVATPPPDAAAARPPEAAP